VTAQENQWCTEIISLPTSWTCPPSGILLGSTKVNQVEPASLLVIQEVTPVGVRLHEAPVVELPEGQLQQPGGDRVPGRLVQLGHLP